MTVHFDDSLVASFRASGGFDFPEGFGQGRAVYGGVVGAALVAAARSQVEPKRRLRTMQAQLMRPAKPGHVEAQVKVLREGSTATFVEVQLSQAQPVATATLVFVNPREGSLHVPPRAPETIKPADALEALPYVPGLTPEFTQHLDLRWANGGYPFSQSPTLYDGYCTFRETVIASGEIGLMALLDAWPCPTICATDRPVASSTVTWTAHLHHVPDSLSPHFRYHYETLAAQDGFSTALGSLYASDGTLCAISEQLVVVFD